MLEFCLQFTYTDRTPPIVRGFFHTKPRGSAMCKWSEVVIPPFLALTEPRPDRVHRRGLEDGLALLAASYTPAGPGLPRGLVVCVEFAPRPSYVPCPPLRFPTFEEIQDAVNHFLPEGLVCIPTGFISVGTGHPATIEFPEETEQVSVELTEVGVVRGSDAAGSSLIIVPGAQA